MKKIEIKKKIINHIMKNGEKNTSEKVLLQSFKELQKKSPKQTKELIKIALINSTPIFKLNKIQNKKLKKKKRKVKEIPLFITSKLSRVSLAIKFILKSVNKRSELFYKAFNSQLFLNSQNKGEAIVFKNEVQKKVLLNKRYFNFFKWR